MFDELDLWLSTKAKNTRRKYSATFAEFMKLFRIQRTANDVDKLRAIGAAEVTRYIAWAQAQPAQPGRSSLISERVSLHTVKQKVVVLRAIFEHLVELELIQRNPWKSAETRLKSVQGNDRRPHRVIPFDKVRELLSLNLGRSAPATRDKALLACLFGGALRSSEILGLRMSDIRVSEKGGCALLLRNTKRQRAEIQVLPTWASMVVLELVEQRKAERAGTHGYLFVSYRGGKPGDVAIADRTLRRMFSGWMEAIGLPGDYSPHDARCTAITRLRTIGLSYEQIMPFSRHTSPVMVAHYDKLLRDEGGAAAELLDYE